MRLSTTIIAATLVVGKAIRSSIADEATCSSLNGPFCAGFGSGFALSPLHARQNLDVSEEEIKAKQVAKNWKIDKILKQDERQVATDEDEEEDFFLSLATILDESLAQLNDVDDEKLNSMAGAFSFTSENGVFELLDEMNGDELKELFETALNEVLVSAETIPEEISSKATEGLRKTARQLKALKDYKTYTFEKLDKSQLANIRQKFANHRLVELQQMFEQLVIADDAHDRQLALETAIFLFQLAQEESNTVNV
ncbi:unnamed protein product [Peronospora farinosa]|uniref:Uncharacterized protein n=1 Tax=Peronospora farinosa TaxID=134698 RepID=A0AAV0SWK3_9STRA|nr:unnamed protein product [Peronospora farinosa]CAI5709817.1 unnamed protein product [Peronospora farinosa]